MRSGMQVGMGHPHFHKCSVNLSVVFTTCLSGQLMEVEMGGRLIYDFFSNKIKRWP